MQVVNSTVSAYYLRHRDHDVQRPQEVHAPQSSPTMQVGMVLAGVMILASGIFPAFFAGLLMVSGL
ncbi:MAG: hypothetical protein OXG36_16185 [Caldilineaceae bacterium]|nr:hypothetical protein [Caldilineaceae bacterium]